MLIKRSISLYVVGFRGMPEKQRGRLLGQLPFGGNTRRSIHVYNGTKHLGHSLSEKAAESTSSPISVRVESSFYNYSLVVCFYKNPYQVFSSLFYPPCVSDLAPSCAWQLLEVKFALRAGVSPLTTFKCLFRRPCIGSEDNFKCRFLKKARARF